MSDALHLPRDEFDSLLVEYRQLVRMVNELEYHLYNLGEVGADPRVAECRQAAGALVGALRNHLFRYDQQVLPLVESHVAGA